MPDDHPHPLDDSHIFRFCPRCGGVLAKRLLKPSEPERLVCTACGFVFYIDPKIAVGSLLMKRAAAKTSALKNEFAKAHAEGVQGLANKDYKTLDKVIQRETALIDELTETLKTVTLKRKRPPSK